MAITREATTGEWIRRLAAAGVPAAPIATFPEVMGAEQLAHRRLTATMPPHPIVRADTVTSVTTGFVADADGPRASATAPALGEHTAAILAEFGYGPQTIRSMAERGLIATADAAYRTGGERR